MHIRAAIKSTHIMEAPEFLAEQCKSKFKDTFTKAVEVFFSDILSEKTSPQDAFILCTNMGNTRNIVRLINEYRTNQFVLSQLFPEATMSSASVNINKQFHLQGGNITANPNLSLNDALLLGLLDSACNARTTHLIYGDVHDFEMQSNIPNHLIYFKMSASEQGSYLNVRGNDVDNHSWTEEDVIFELKAKMSPALYQFIRASNTQGEVTHVYHSQQLAYA